MRERPPIGLLDGGVIERQLDDPERAKYPWTLLGNALPLSWYMKEDGGREFYTALGHKKEHYANPILYRHILGGILWAMGEKE